MGDKNVVAPVVAQAFGETATVAGTRPLAGDMSTRRYVRVDLGSQAEGHPSTAMAMLLPPDALASDERTAGETPQELPFLDVQRMLAKRGMPVPQIYGYDRSGGVVLLEDLGDETFESRVRVASQSQTFALYGQAIDLLANMHEQCAIVDSTESIAFRRRFEASLLRWELDHFEEWGLSAVGSQPTPAERQLLASRFDVLARRITALPTGFVHRDYQSRNLMFDRQGALRLIDFQDALIGPQVYDLVALLCDSYVDLDEELQAAMLARYAEARAHVDAEGLINAFWLVAAQRKLKDAGRFIFIDRVRANPDFLRWYPRSLIYVDRALLKLGEMDLRSVLVNKIAGYPNDVATPAPNTGAST